MKLEDTIEGMLSADFKERLKAEYQQVSKRVLGLNEYLLKDDVDVFDRELLELQLYYMTGYRHILVIRANHLGIKL